MSENQTKRRYMNDGKSTPFSDWLRSLERPLDSSVFSNQNLDYVWHNYRSSWLILIEEKQYDGWQTDAQEDTHSILDQMLRHASGVSVKTMRGLRPVTYRGYYLIKFTKTSPDDSGVVTINGHVYFDPPAAVRHLLTEGALPAGCVEPHAEEAA